MRALITGASSGFGAEFAKQLAEKGYDVVLVARREDKLVELCVNLANLYGIKAEYFTADLGTIEGIKLAQSEIEKRDFDLLINNAGRGNLNGYLNSTFEDLQSMMTLNMATIVHLSQTAVNKWIRENKAGKIINVASIASFLFDGTFAMYAATKAFARAISYGIDASIKEAGANIQVQCLCPGLAKTEFMGPEFTNEQLTAFGFMEASDVVAESIAKLETGEFIVIPGEKNVKEVEWFKATDPLEIRPKMQDLIRATGLHF